MRLRGLAVVVAALVFATSCRHREEGSVPDAQLPSQQPAARENPVMQEDTTTPDFQAGAPKLPLSHEFTLQTDTAARTDLRMFSRKQKVFYGASLLYGEWTRGTEHEQYLPDGTGRFWDTGDDVGCGEALQFRWTLDSNVLQMVFKLTMGGVVPKEYLVTFADDESLVYRDDVGDSYMWDKAADGSGDRPTAVPLVSSGNAKP